MISVVKEDMLTADVDLIVNAANTHMEHMGGIAGAIRKAAGPRLVIESKRQRPVPTGAAIVTSAGNMRRADGTPYQGVVHVVGPIWGGGSFDERKLLHLAHRSALVKAHELADALARPVSIAFPAVSCGIFGFPIAEAAPIAVRAAATYIDHFNVHEIRFCLLDDLHVEHYTRALEAMQR